MTRCLLPAIALLTALVAARSAAADSGEWPAVGNDKGGTRFSPLDQINRDNVGRLQVAWTYHTNDPGNIECTPICIDGRLYVTTARTHIVSLNAATGEEIWRFDPFSGQSGRGGIRASGGVNRGVAYWSDGRPNGQRRILSGLSDGRLISLDAATGKLDSAFGDGGVVDLRAGITEWDTSRMQYGCTAAPMIFENLVFLGFATGEGGPSAPGDNRAFDVRTGKEVWRFHMVPRPGEPFGDTWPADAWKQRGGANAWAGFTLDEERGILFCGTGSATSDFYGGDRKGDNLFANCVLAQDARTGRRLWHFQTVHHDLWDHDNPSPPVLCTVTRNGQSIPAVAQFTKTGYCFVLDRVTGKPLFDVKEVPVPQSDVPGEYSSPTQPVPTAPPPLCPQLFADSDITNISPQAHDAVARRLAELRHGLNGIPPSIQGTVYLPGFHGGANWSGGSFDPTSGLLYVNINNVPWVQHIRPGRGSNFGTDGYNRFLDPEGYPGVKPPWGTLTAIDPSQGKIVWQVPLGEYPELTARGVPPTGTENFGGTIITAGGLVFIGGTKDEQFHAFDKATGRLLWHYKLPAGGYATPCTYAAGGKQYVVIAAGGAGKLGTRPGDSFIAFSLP